MKRTNILIVLILIAISLIAISVNAQTLGLNISGKTAVVELEFDSFDKGIKTFINISVMAKTSVEFTVLSNNLITYYVDYNNKLYTCSYSINREDPTVLIISTRVVDIREELIEFISNE